MRLNQFLARAGLGSRRSVEGLIRDGRIRINGVPADLSSRVDSEQDKVTFDGRLVRLPSAFTYVVLHKPAGYTATRTDPHGGRTVYELLPKPWRRLAYVGRLDRDSEGVLLFTDDGELTHKLLRPEYGVDREYVVETDQPPPAGSPEHLIQGVHLDDGFVAKAETAEVLTNRANMHALRLILTEGKKREVRRMCKALSINVLRLIRTRFGPVALGDLPSGQARELTTSEITALGQSVATRKKAVSNTASDE
jgi:23S rRNA pseudouridine2605 synthase